MPHRTEIENVSLSSRTNPGADGRPAVPISAAPGHGHAGAHCPNALLAQVCEAGGTAGGEFTISRDTGHLCTLRTVARGESLYRAGDPFSHVYVVRHGAFKTVSTTDASAPHVNGLRFVGEVLGLEGAANDRYKDHAIALESSAVCVISFALLEGLASEAAPVQRAVHRLMSADMARESAVIMMLTMRSERRVAMFLLDVLQRMPAHRVQHGEGGVVAFALPLSRAELGSYLGLRLETISRVISSFQEAGLIAISRKGITIYQPQALAAL